MNLIDTHAHIDMLSNPKQAIIEARESGVKEIIIPSASEESFENILKICDEFEDIYALLGVHPEDCEKFSDETAKKIMDLSKHPKVVGIGEIGLDYHYTKENKDIQKKVFKTQLEIAKVLDLPVVIHDREAHSDTLEILKETGLKKVLLHCYSGSVEFMRECTKLGYKIALGGVVTFKNAREPKEVAQMVNLDDLMLETDCPYLAPHPFRGQENSPKFIGFVAKEIANLRNMPYDSVVLKTSQNAREFFNLKNK